jgi:hypothetical protein
MTSGFVGSPFDSWADPIDFKQQAWRVLAALGQPVTVPAGGTIESSRGCNAWRPLDHGLFGR